MRPALIVALFLFAVPLHAKPQIIKIKCPGTHGSRVLWDGPGSVVSIGEVKCGSKVTLLWQSVSYLWIETKDKRKGYLLADAMTTKVNRPNTGRVLMESVIAGLNGYARTADPHITWCDDRGGFLGRAVDSSPVTLTGNDGLTLSGTVSSTYVVCKDGTRFKE